MPSGDWRDMNGDKCGGTSLVDVEDKAVLFRVPDLLLSVSSVLLEVCQWSGQRWLEQSRQEA